MLIVVSITDGTKKITQPGPITSIQLNLLYPFRETDSLRVVFLEQTPAFLPSVSRIVACTIAVQSRGGLSASSACSFLPGFQCLQSFHLLEYVFEKFFSVYNVQVATDLGVFTCELIELLLSQRAEFRV